MSSSAAVEGGTSRSSQQQQHAGTRRPNNKPNKSKNNESGTRGATDRGERGNNNNWKRRQRTVGVLGMIFFTFVSTSAGPFGIESSVKAAGAVGTIGFVLLVPLVLMIPIILMMWELSGQCGLTNHGNVKWVSRAFGPAVGYISAMFQIGMNFVDLATYPVLAANYLTPLFFEYVFVGGPPSSHHHGGPPPPPSHHHQNHHHNINMNNAVVGGELSSSSKIDGTSSFTKETATATMWWFRQAVQVVIIIAGGVPCLYPISAVVTRLSEIVTVLVCSPFVVAFCLILWEGWTGAGAGGAGGGGGGGGYGSGSGGGGGTYYVGHGHNKNGSGTHGGLFFGTPSEWQPAPNPMTWNVWATAFSIGVWLYVGFLANSSLAGEVTHHTVFLKGQLIALVIDTFMYLIPLMVVLGVHGSWGDGFLAEAYAVRFSSSSSSTSTSSTSTFSSSFSSYPHHHRLSSSSSPYYHDGNDVRHSHHTHSSDILSSFNFWHNPDFWRIVIGLAGFMSGFGLYVTSVAMFSRTLWGVSHMGWFPKIFAISVPSSSHSQKKEVRGIHDDHHKKKNKKNKKNTHTFSSSISAATAADDRRRGAKEEEEAKAKTEGVDVLSATVTGKQSNNSIQKNYGSCPPPPPPRNSGGAGAAVIISVVSSEEEIEQKKKEESLLSSQHHMEEEGDQNRIIGQGIGHRIGNDDVVGVAQQPTVAAQRLNASEEEEEGVDILRCDSGKQRQDDKRGVVGIDGGGDDDDDDRCNDDEGGEEEKEAEDHNDGDHDDDSGADGVPRNAVVALMISSVLLGVFEFDFLVQLMFVIAAVIFTLFAMSYMVLRDERLNTNQRSQNHSSSASASSASASVSPLARFRRHVQHCSQSLALCVIGGDVGRHGEIPTSALSSDSASTSAVSMVALSRPPVSSEGVAENHTKQKQRQEEEKLELNDDKLERGERGIGKKNRVITSSSCNSNKNTDRTLTDTSPDLDLDLGLELDLPSVPGGRLATYGLPALVILHMILVFLINVLSDDGGKLMVGFILWTASVVLLARVLKPRIVF